MDVKAVKAVKVANAGKVTKMSRVTAVQTARVGILDFSERTCKKLLPGIAPSREKA